MRPTVIRLIAGGALGIAFSISLTLPGSVVFPDEPPIRQLAAPEPPAARIVRAARVVERPSKAPTSPRVVVQRIYVPTPGTSVVAPAPPRSTPSRKPVERVPVARQLTPLATPPAARVTEPAEEPKEADEPKKAEKPRKAGRPKAETPRKAKKPKKADKPKKAKKPKDPGSKKKDKPDDARKKDRDDQGDDRSGRDEGDHGGGRGDDSSRG